MLIIDIIRCTLRGLVTAVAAVTVIAGAVLLLLMGWLLRIIAPGRHSASAPSAMKYAEFTQNFKESKQRKSKSQRIPDKIYKDLN